MSSKRRSAQKILCVTDLLVGEFHGGFNPLEPNDAYRGGTAPLTSKVAFYIFIQPI